MKATTAKLALTLLAAALGTSLLSAQTAPAAGPAPENPLQPLARLVGGEWRGELKLVDGTLIRARHLFEWALDGALLKVKTYGAVGDRPEKLAYEGIVGWHPGQKAIVFREFSAWGGVNDGTIEPLENALAFSWRELTESGATEYRETLRFPDNDHYVSEAFKRVGDGWEKFAESSFHREAFPAGAGEAPRLPKE